MGEEMVGGWLGGVLRCETSSFRFRVFFGEGGERGGEVWMDIMDMNIRY